MQQPAKRIFASGFLKSAASENQSSTSPLALIMQQQHLHWPLVSGGALWQPAKTCFGPKRRKRKSFFIVHLPCIQYSR